MYCKGNKKSKSQYSVLKSVQKTKKAIVANHAKESDHKTIFGEGRDKILLKLQLPKSREKYVILISNNPQVDKQLYFPS